MSYKSGDRIIAKLILGTEFKGVVKDVLPNGKMSIYIDDAKFPGHSDYQNRYKTIPTDSANVWKEPAGI